MNRRMFVSLATSITLMPMTRKVFAQTAVPPEFTTLGVQEDGRWISPQFGVEVTWDAPFVLDYTPGASIFSNEYGDQFNISLPDTRALFNVSISGPGNTAYQPLAQAEASIRSFEESNAPSFLLFTATEEYVGALVVIEWGASVITGEDIPNQVFLFQVYPSSNNPDVVIQTRIDARYDDFEDYVRALGKHVTIDGGSGLRAFELQEILDVIPQFPPEEAS